MPRGKEVARVAKTIMAQEAVFCYAKRPFERKQRMNDQESLREQLALLKDEHRDLDDAIQALSQRAMPDMIQIQRLKKKKLQLRDEIAQIESQLLPNIIA